MPVSPFYALNALFSLVSDVRAVLISIIEKEVAVENNFDDLQMLLAIKDD